MSILGKCHAPPNPGRPSMSAPGIDDRLRALFEHIDARDTDGWLAYMSNDGQF